MLRRCPWWRCHDAFLCSSQFSKIVRLQSSPFFPSQPANDAGAREATGCEMCGRAGEGLELPRGRASPAHPRRSLVGREKRDCFAVYKIVARTTEFKTLIFTRTFYEHCQEVFHDLEVLLTVCWMEDNLWFGTLLVRIVGGWVGQDDADSSQKAI